MRVRLDWVTRFDQGPNEEGVAQRRVTLAMRLYSRPLSLGGSANYPLFRHRRGRASGCPIKRQPKEMLLARRRG